MTIVHMGRGVGADWCTVANDPKEAREQEGRWPVPCWFLGHLWCLVSLATVVPQSVERECGGINPEMWLASKGSNQRKGCVSIPSCGCFRVAYKAAAWVQPYDYQLCQQCLYVCFMLNNYFASKVSKYQLYPIPDGGYGSRLQGKLSIYI